MQGQRRRVNPPYEQTWDAQSKHIYCHCMFHDQESVLKVVDLGLASVCKTIAGDAMRLPRRDQEGRIDKETQGHQQRWERSPSSIMVADNLSSPFCALLFQASSSTKAIQDVQGASSPFRVQPTRLGAQAGR